MVVADLFPLENQPPLLLEVLGVVAFGPLEKPELLELEDVLRLPLEKLELDGELLRLPLENDDELLLPPEEKLAASAK